MDAPEVLVVEDDEDIRDSLMDFLEDHGYVAVGASDGRDALTRLTGVKPPPPSIIILDLMMPIMDGRTFLEEQRRDPALAGIPVIVISAYREIPAGIHELGIAGHMRKPLDLNGLLAMLKQHRLPRS